MMRNLGRKSIITDDAQREAILAWEQRDTLTFGMKLNEFFAEKFGMTPDDVPLVPAQTFFWLAEIVYKEPGQVTLILGCFVGGMGCRPFALFAHKTIFNLSAGL